MKTLLAALLLTLGLSAPALAKPVAVDVLLDTFPPGVTGANPDWTAYNGKGHIGFAAGPRFGNKVAIVPLVNYWPHWYGYGGQKKASFRPGIAAVYAVSPHIDLGVGEILREYNRDGLTPGVTPAGFAVLLGYRL